MKKLNREEQDELAAFLSRIKNSKNLVEVNTAKKQKLRNNMRGNLWASIRTKKNIGNAEFYLGCTISELLIYIESLFEQGMTWENHGYHGWHIDHIKPFFMFDLMNEDQKKEVGHYTNLRPIWYKDHRAKTKKEKSEMKDKIVSPRHSKKEDYD